MAGTTDDHLPATGERALGDGDLVRLARAGDPVAFRLLVERHQPMARARASRLCRPDEVDDVVQESFLQAFATLDRLRDADRFAGWQDYSCSAQDGCAVLASAVPQPHGSAFLRQAVFADDYRGAPVVFRGEFRTEDVADRAGLILVVVPGPLRPGRDGGVDHEAGGGHLLTITDSRSWTKHEITAEVPDEAEFIRFGITLTGPGRVELRNVELARNA